MTSTHAHERRHPCAPACRQLRAPRHLRLEATHLYRASFHESLSFEAIALRAKFGAIMCGSRGLVRELNFRHFGCGSGGKGRLRNREKGQCTRRKRWVLMEDYRYGKNSLFKDDHPFLGTWLFFLIMIVLGFITFYRFGEISRSVRALVLCVCTLYGIFLFLQLFTLQCRCMLCTCLSRSLALSSPLCLSFNLPPAPGHACVCVLSRSLPL